MADIDIQFSQLFPTIVARVQMSMIEPIRDALVADVLALAEDPVPGAPGRQTKGQLQDRTEPHWTTLYEAMTQVIDYLGTRDDPSVVHTWQHKGWGLVYDRPESYESLDERIHSHWGYTFSTVLWLDLPDELASGDAGGGTSFRDPLSFVRRGAGFGMARWHQEPPRLLDLLVFPSHIEHAPMPPAASVTSYSRPRVIVSTDFLRR